MTLESEALNSFTSDETFQSLLQAISDQQQKRSGLILASAMNIEEQLIPILHELLEQIKRKMTDPDNSWTQLDRELTFDTELYMKLSADLRNALMKQQWKGDSMENLETIKDAPKDPWLTNLALQKHIATCYLKQEKYRNYIEKQEDEFSAFEAAVLQNIKVSLSTFYEFRTHWVTQQSEEIRAIKECVDQLDPERDWAIFRNRKKDIFNSGKQLKPPEEIFYDGYDDPLLNEVKKGRLYKKEGVFKKQFRPLYAVLTKANMLHLLPEKNPGHKFHPLPEVSLDLSQYTLQPLMMNEKEPEEIALLAKTGGIFGRDVKYKFKGESMADSAEWWGHMNEQMKLALQRPSIGSWHSVNDSRKNSNVAAIPETIPENSSVGPKIRKSFDQADKRPSEVPQPEPRRSFQQPTPELQYESPATFTPDFADFSRKPAYANQIYIPDLQDFPQDSLPTHQKQLSVTQKMEQMELELKLKAGIVSPVIPEPEFDSMPTMPSRINQPPANVWDTFQNEDKGW